MQHATTLHGSLLHAWGPILATAALSGIGAEQNRRLKKYGKGDAEQEQEEAMAEVEWAGEGGAVDEDGSMRPDCEELSHLAHCGAGTPEARCDAPPRAPRRPLPCTSA